jgi:hypothetical protein
MRQQRMNLALVMALIAVLVICPGPAQAEPTRITFTGHEVCGDLVGGTVTTHDGMTFLRDAVSVCTDTADNPMGSGTNYVTFNANSDANGNGPLWGKTHFVTNEGGAWEISWNGMGTATGFHGHAEVRGVGMYKGLVAKITLDNDGINPSTVGWEILHVAD